MRILKLKLDKDQKNPDAVPKVEILRTDESVFVMHSEVDYVVSDDIVQSFRERGYAKYIVRDDDFYDFADEKKYRGQDLTNKTIITFRSGGIGDLLFQCPSLKYLKRKFTGLRIIMCCGSQYKTMFDNLDYVDRLISLPVKLNDIISSDYYVNFEGLIEANKEAETKNAYDLYAERFFVELENPVPVLKVKPDIKQEIYHRIKNKYDGKIITIAFSATVPIRTVNTQLYIDLINSCKDENVKFYIIATKNQTPVVDKMIRDIIERDPSFVDRVINWGTDYSKNLQYTMALVALSDIVIGPDSGILHIAGALGIPMIGIFGAFPSPLRLKYYKKAIGLDSLTNCIFSRGEWSSCFQHGSGVCNLAKKNLQVFSPCMNFHRFDIVRDCLKELGIVQKEFKLQT